MQWLSWVTVKLCYVMAVHQHAWGCGVGWSGVGWGLIERLRGNRRECKKIIMQVAMLGTTGADTKSSGGWSMKGGWVNISRQGANMFD